MHQTFMLWLLFELRQDRADAFPSVYLTICPMPYVCLVAVSFASLAA